MMPIFYSLHVQALKHTKRFLANATEQISFNPPVTEKVLSIISNIEALTIRRQLDSTMFFIILLNLLDFSSVASHFSMFHAKNEENSE
jgi:hypothetical protein